MSSVEFEGSMVLLEEGETVLQGLTRHGYDIPSGCQAGICQACVMAADEMSNVSNAQNGLSESARTLNHFLSCQCKPDTAIRARKVSTAGTYLQGEVIAKEVFNEEVIRLRIKAALDYRPGQYVTLWKNDHTPRSYSLASHPALNDYLELHIKRMPDGKFSQWAYATLAVGDTLGVQGPLGHCFYTEKDKQQPLLLMAIGTGLAPIYGILQDALSQGHEGAITLLVGARTAQDFYLVDELLALEKANPLLSIHFVSQLDQAEFSTKGDVYATALKLVPSLAGWRVFLCGAESFVKKMRKQCFLVGASMSDISADIFLPCS